MAAQPRPQSRKGPGSRAREVQDRIIDRVGHALAKEGAQFEQRDWAGAWGSIKPRLRAVTEEAIRAAADGPDGWLKISFGYKARVLMIQVLPGEARDIKKYLEDDASVTEVREHVRVQKRVGKIAIRREATDQRSFAFYDKERDGVLPLGGKGRIAYYCDSGPTEIRLLDGVIDHQFKAQQNGYKKDKAGTKSLLAQFKANPDCAKVDALKQKYGWKPKA